MRASPFAAAAAAAIARSASRALVRRPERSITVAHTERAMSRSSSASLVASVLASILSTRSAGNFWMAASMISWSSSGVARRALSVTAVSSHASMPAVSRGSGMGVAMWSWYSFLAARSCAFGSSIVVLALTWRSSGVPCGGPPPRSSKSNFSDMVSRMVSESAA